MVMYAPPIVSTIEPRMVIVGVELTNIIHLKKLLMLTSGIMLTINKHETLRPLGI